MQLPVLILGQLCQIESENKILHKFIDMTTENFNVELRKVICMVNVITRALFKTTVGNGPRDLAVIK